MSAARLQGDCFSWGYNINVSCTCYIHPAYAVNAIAAEHVVLDAIVGNVVIQSVATLDLGQAGSSQCTLFRQVPEICHIVAPL